MKVKQCKDILEIRKNIDRLDDKIVKLISERGAFVKQAGKFKKNEDAVKDTNRVAQVLEKVRTIAVKYKTDPLIIEEVYKTMINCFIDLEMKELKK
jgi:isochorismate pyruvate lyase